MRRLEVVTHSLWIMCQKHSERLAKARATGETIDSSYDKLNGNDIFTCIYKNIRPGIYNLNLASLYE